jgi:hypothetical protein
MAAGPGTRSQRIIREQIADPNNWRVAEHPFPSPPCRCDRPAWQVERRDSVPEITCVKCGRRPRLRGDRHFLLTGVARSLIEPGQSWPQTLKP